MLVHHLKGGRIESLAFGPDGRVLVTPRRDGGVLVWADVTAGDPPRALARDFVEPDGSKQFDTPHGRVRLSTDGRRVGCRGWNRAVVYDLGGVLPATFGHEFASSHDCAALTPSGDAVVFSQARPGERAHTRLSLRPVADPRPAAERWALDLDRRVWDEAAFLPGGRFVLPELAYTGRWPSVAFHWVVRDLAMGRELVASPDLGREAAQAEAAPDGRWVAGVYSKHLVAWRPDDPGAPPVERKNDSRLPFTGLAFHPSGAFLATTSTDTTVRVYETATWAVVRTYAWGVGELRCVAFSPDGLLAAAGSDTGRIVVWDVDL